MPHGLDSPSCLPWSVSNLHIHETQHQPLSHSPLPTVENLNLNSNLNFYLFYTRQPEGEDRRQGSNCYCLVQPEGAIAEWIVEWSTCCALAGVMTSLDAGYQTEARHNPPSALARSLIWHRVESVGGGGGPVPRPVGYSDAIFDIFIHCTFSMCNFLGNLS